MKPVDPLTSANAGDQLVAAVPELRRAYEDSRERWKGESPGLHITFGEVVNPYLVRELQARDSGDDLSRIFDFLERMSSTDDELANVVAVTVCERLGDEPLVLRRARRLMGHTTLGLSREVERFWGRESP